MTTLVDFVGNLAGYYAPTEAAILQAILKSNFVHVDETKINIQGVDHYVWVFTDGKHVMFRMTETREADIVREVLAGYQGVLVCDFYPGYDSMPCRQQKCWSTSFVTSTMISGRLRSTRNWRRSPWKSRLCSFRFSWRLIAMG